MRIWLGFNAKLAFIIGMSEILTASDHGFVSRPAHIVIMSNLQIHIPHLQTEYRFSRENLLLD